MKKIEFSESDLFVLDSLLQFAIENLHTCSAANSFEGLARRIAKDQIAQVLEKIQK